MRILITGARSGIGYQTGITLAKIGHLVYLTVHTDNQLKTLKEKVGKLNLNIYCLKLDITKENDRRKILDLDIDCLINNASIAYSGPLLEIDTNLIKENFEVNVLATLKLSQLYATSLFINKKKGKIIFISSLAGIIPISFLSPYCITKASLITLATCFKNELKLITKNIQVKLIEPGIYNTGFNEVMINNKLKQISKYYDLLSISLKQEKLFKLIGKNNLNSIVLKIVDATLDNSNKFIYRAPLTAHIIAKIYMLLFK